MNDGVASTILSSGSYKSAINAVKSKAHGRQQFADESEISPTVAVDSAEVIYVIIL